MTDETDYELIVTVRVYGAGNAEDAAQALMGYRSTFDLLCGGEAEILHVQVPP